MVALHLVECHVKKLNAQDLMQQISKSGLGADLHIFLEKSGSLSVDELLNWEEFLRFWAVEQWLCASDSYNYNKNNYRVYFDKKDGKAQLFPWDQDSIYYSPVSLSSPSGILSCYCQQDPDCMEHMYEEVDHVCTVADSMGLDELYSKTTALIQPYIEADPRREQSTDTISSYQGLVSTWIGSRSAELRAAWGIE